GILTSATFIWSLSKAQKLFTCERNWMTHTIVSLSAILSILIITSLTKLAEFYVYPSHYTFSVSLLGYSILLLLLGTTIYRLYSFLKNKSYVLNSGFQKPGSDDALSKPEWNDSDIEWRAMAVTLERKLIDDQLFRNHNISLDILAEITQIPKYKLSHLINNFFNKSFYQFIGEYRIRYAMEVMDKDDNISFDALSDLCGFNSKSTFYKYFKMINGCTPNTYMKNHFQHRTD